LAKLKAEGVFENNLSSSSELESSKLESVEMVDCPALGELSKQKCLEHQSRPLKFATANPFTVRMWRACRNGCPNSLIGPDGEPIDIEEPEDPQAEQEVFVERLKLLINKVAKNNESQFARKAGLSNSGLKRYLAGGDPSRRKLIAIAKSNKVNLLWLATGEWPMRGELPNHSTPCAGSVGVAALVRALQLVELVQAEAPLEQKARAAALAYNLLADPAQPLDAERIQRLLEPLLKGI